MANQTYRDLKDRQQLIRYRGKVERGSAEEKMIDELLGNLVRAAGHSYYDFLSCDLTHSASCSSKSGGRTNLQTLWKLDSLQTQDMSVTMTTASCQIIRAFFPWPEKGGLF